MNRRSIAVCAVALAFLTLSGKAALAQDRGRDRRHDSTRARPDTTPEADNGANTQGGHVTSDADRAVIQADLERQARQAEADRRGRPSSDQDRQTAERNRQAAERDRQAGDRNREAAERDRQAADRNRQGAQGGRSFNDNDREATRDWYRQNRTRLGAGWRDQDRLTPAMQGRLRLGYQLDPELRGRMYSLPPELSGRYGPAPRGYRYVIIGGNIVMLDGMYQVHDVFSLDVQVAGRYSNDRNDWNERDGWAGGQRRSFNDRDRQATREWYRRHRGSLGRGWREQDRLSPEMEARLRPGRQLDPELRQRMVWLPPELSARYGPAPRGYRYAIIGGNVVMIDDGYRVHDVFSITLSF